MHRINYLKNDQFKKFSELKGKMFSKLYSMSISVYHFAIGNYKYWGETNLLSIKARLIQVEFYSFVTS